MDDVGDAAVGGDDRAPDEGRWGSDVELVAEPIRYPRSPLVALVVIALVPALALLVAHRWAAGEADARASAGASGGLLEARLDGALAVDGRRPGAGGVEAGAGPPAAALATAVLDYRRTPSLLVAAGDVDRLAGAVEPVLSFVGDRSCAAVSLDGVPVAAANPSLSVVPASDQKLLVALAALELLGPDRTFTTTVVGPPVVDGTVDGDLVLVGGGDPLLTSDDYPRDDPRLTVASPTSLDALADAIVGAGVQRVRGSIVGDGTRYDDEFAVPDWAEGVAGVDAGPYDALLVNDALVVGRTSRQSDPSEAAARELRRLLRDRGVAVDGDVRSGVAPEGAATLASIDSVPLADVIGEMLLLSDNDTAELLLKELGVEVAGQGTRAAGLEALVGTLERLGVPMDGVTPRDGSGLSNSNRVTCAALLAVVQLARGGPIDAGLPVAGVSGTLADEFGGTAMVGRLRAKTGTLGNEPFDQPPPAVKALSGYVDPPEGSGAARIEFSLVLNGPDLSLPERYRPLWLALGDVFATHPAGPDLAVVSPR